MFPRQRACTTFGAAVRPMRARCGSVHASCTASTLPSTRTIPVRVNGHYNPCTHRCDLENAVSRFDSIVTGGHLLPRYQSLPRGTPPSPPLQNLSSSGAGRCLAALTRIDLASWSKPLSRKLPVGGERSWGRSGQCLERCLEDGCLERVVCGLSPPKGKHPKTTLRPPSLGKLGAWGKTDGLVALGNCRLLCAQRLRHNLRV